MTHKNDSVQGFNDTLDNPNDDLMADELESNSSQIEFEVTGGRDDTLLKLLAKKMNFAIEYKDPPEKTQGIAHGNTDNLSFTGGLGTLQRRVKEIE